MKAKVMANRQAVKRTRRMGGKNPGEGMGALSSTLGVVVASNGVSSKASSGRAVTLDDDGDILPVLWAPQITGEGEQ